MKKLEKKVNLLIDYVTAESGSDTESILSELRMMKEEASKKTVKRVTEDILTHLGIPTRLAGYTYAVSAIEFLVEDPKLHKSIVKGLYSKIAEKHNCSSGGVERCIRHSIEVLCERGDADVIYEFFGNAIHTDKGKPTNSEFLSRLCQEVEREMESN